MLIRKLISTLLLCGSLILLPSTLRAANCSISVSVTDPSGATLGKARTLLVELKTLRTRQATAEWNGKYSFEGLQPGNYTIIVIGPESQACWVPMIRQVKVQSRKSQTLKFQMRLDPDKCPGDEFR